MAKKAQKLERRLKIKKRIRKKISGTAEIPRMSVFRSNRAIYVQFIDDLTGRTLASADSREVSSEGKLNANVASEVGKKAAEKAKAAGIEKVVFDRNGYLYHGRIKALADAAREGGLQF